MIITRENLNEEVSNLNDEIIALAQVESLDAEAIKKTVGNERFFYDADEEVPPENAGETFKKMLIKEVVENEH